MTTPIISELLTLGELDRRILRGKQRLQEMTRSVDFQEKRLNEAREKVLETEKTIRDNASTTDRHNLDIRTYEAEADEQNRKLKIIKNQKEYRIVSDRIKELRQMVDEWEDAVLAGMEQLDKGRTLLIERQNTVGEEDLKLTTLRKDKQRETDAIRVTHQALMGERELLVSKIQSLDTAAYSAYEHALKRTKGDAMAEMTMDGVCQSCFMRQNSNVLNIVHIGKDIANCRCQSCGRILYVKPSAQATS